MAYVYILQSKQDASYYIGQTENIADRLYRHNTAQSVSTKAKIPWELVYVEEFDAKSSAIKRELQIKKQKSKKYIERLIKSGRGSVRLERPDIT